MAFTRFNYDKARVQKNVYKQLAGRYVKCSGNAGDRPEIYNDHNYDLKMGW